MLKQFLPDQHVDSVLEIQPSFLKEKGIKGIITDLDNTLVAWDHPNATPELLVWLKSVKDAGLKVTIVSNNNRERVRSFSDPIETPFIYKARKPMTRSFKKALLDMNLSRDEVVVIGDQLMTDVLGGNRMGLHTILVVPVAKNDAWATRLNRRMEQMILSILRKKGLIDWEDHK